MVLRWVVNAGLLAIPIGGTVGALMGIDAHRHATGQAPLFSGGGGGGSSSGSGSGGSGSTTHNGVNNTLYCQKSYGITPDTKGQSFTLNPNQWGLIGDTVGALCMNVTTFENGTYATKNTAPEFSVTWQFDQGPSTQPVHAFSNVMIDDGLPVSLEKIQHLNVDFHWTYGVGNTPAAATDEAELTSASVNTNVAIDMFMGPNEKAKESTDYTHEVMVWFGKFGPAAYVIGQEAGIVATKVLNGTTFNLYSGQNSNKQSVLTWLTSDSPNDPQAKGKTTETFTGDLLPLIADLYTMTGEAYPSKSDYMGIFQFGTEAFSSSTNVTFWVPQFSVDMQ
ncbi:hypothetical protein Asppvi_006018 [Aspergillus pseudoviridinutans]|uniref:xyloglucan-specific endo-beta-1,4-glucanase n=1 Tax=Aspergillus pseudoviridinutans TaxID=1517512 RepID=A0A9P3EVT4_9EURO|nr:uncharacterized protein Asppvi_006018 [Aspergillus pseudoviridinutans]GIJ87115.1 hypothetical protein Asppvi_006018 [Aspergillus pseudoviridinutans]